MPHAALPAASNTIPRNHVPGRGPAPCALMLVGEAPGPRENALRQPFVGGAGQELERYCRSAGINPADVYITNLCKLWPPVDARGKQLPPTPADIAHDEPELLMEIDAVRPRVIAAIGAHAARYFLGERSRPMRALHGIPHIVGDRVIVPVLHPAAGLHSMLQEEMARIQWDFQQVGRIMRGELSTERVDEFPSPSYRRLSNADTQLLAELLAGRTVVGLDTEGTIADPECITIAVEPGEGWMLPATEADLLAILNQHINAPHGVCTVIGHYLTHDIPVAAAMGVDIDRRRALEADGTLSIRDTMSELHLLGGTEPKGLKAAAWRALATEMEDYEEVIAADDYRVAWSYFEAAYGLTACGTCAGTGKVLAYRWVDSECELCGGSGRIEGKRAGTAKNCSCVTKRDRCRVAGCVDGLFIPMPAKVFEFDSAKGEFRWKQPQSAARWLRRRLGQPDLTAGPDVDSNTEFSADDADDEGYSVETQQYLQLRRDWRDLDPAIRQLIESHSGRMPRTRLLECKDSTRVIRYACRDADTTLRLAGTLDRRIRELGLTQARAIDAAILPALARMEQTGMMIDREHFEKFHADLQYWLAAERDKLNQLVGEHNPNSRRMVGVLFRDLGLPTIKLTATSQESTDDETLGVLKAQLSRQFAGGDERELVKTGIAVIDCMQTYREFQKMDSTYVLALLRAADEQDRVHTTLNYTKSVTRLSSQGPNLQNIPNPANSPFGDDPVRNMGLRMRSGFVARPGYSLVSCDFSSIEMVVGAHLTQDENLLRIFREGLDPHRYAASEFLGVPMAEVTGPLRTQFKTINFAVFYDTSAMTMQRQFALMQPPIDKTEIECQQLIDWYFGVFAPGVQAWKDRVRRGAQADGYVRTMFGRLRWMPGLRSNIRRVRLAAERECTNQPVQGTAGDILRIAMALLDEHVMPALHAEGIDAQAIMTVHDEVIIEAPDEHAGLVGEVCAGTMQSAVRLSVPMKVGVGIGKSWAEAH